MKHIKTELGQQAFKERSTLLSPRQRSAFIVFDGVKSTEEIVQSMSVLGLTLADVEYMVLQGFLADVAPAAAPPPVAAVPAAASGDAADAWAQDSEMGGDVVRFELLSKQERYAMACPIATQLTSTLGLRGFRLNLAVQGAADFDALVVLLPKIQDAVGLKPCRQLARILKI
jgi:hypothetical protein